MSRRDYNQFCATARALDVVGERWTLLIVRELLSGPKRFKDLQAALPGIGTGLLSARLRFLTEEGLVQQTTLPPPANAPAYELTPAGLELEPAVLALAHWGLKWALGDRRADDAFEPGWAVLGMQAVFDPAGAGGLDLVYEFRVDDAVFHAHVLDGEIETRQGPGQRPDVVITTSRESFAQLAAGELSLRDGVKAGLVDAQGDREALLRLRSLFVWPEQADRTASG